MTAAGAYRVSRRFGAVLAVDDVSFEVGAGEIVGLVGANGAGKTMLLRTLLGLLAPTAGRVRLLGEPPSRRVRRRVGYLPQGLGLYDDLTVAENLAFAAAAFGVTHPPADPELDARRRDVVRDLPLGLRRRVAFAVALGHRPALLILDEPTSGVDPLARNELWTAIHEAAEGGVGVLVSTHHLDEAEQCDRLVVLAAGRLVAEGTLEGIVGGATTAEVRGADRPAAFAALDRAALPVALAGPALRVPGVEAGWLRRFLAERGVEAEVREEPATFDETFAALAGRAAEGGLR